MNLCLDCAKNGFSREVLEALILAAWSGQKAQWARVDALHTGGLGLSPGFNPEFRERTLLHANFHLYNALHYLKLSDLMFLLEKDLGQSLAPKQNTPMLAAVGCPG